MNLFMASITGTYDGVTLNHPGNTINEDSIVPLYVAIVLIVLIIVLGCIGKLN